MTSSGPSISPEPLSYEPRQRRWTFKPPPKRVLAIWVIVFAFIGFTTCRDWWQRRADTQRREQLQLAERKFNGRVAPLLKANPRFHWVLVVGEAGYIRGYISPNGVVQSQADLAALRTLLQGARPPMPIDLQFVTVFPGLARILPPTTQSTTAPINGGPAGR